MSDPRFAMILGFPRSGTTVLRQILDGHPEISCPPEPWLTTACARFLSETQVDGPPIGVRTGLGFSGIPEDVVFAELRAMVLRLHGRIAGEARVYVEKSGFDIFHLETLLALFGSETRVIGMVRDPLDTIASNLDLAARLGRFLPELAPYLAAHNSPAEGLAAAWAERMARLPPALEGLGANGCLVRYEDLVQDPLPCLAPIWEVLGVTPMDADMLEQAMAAPLRLGLGDWKASAQTDLNAQSIGRWRKSLSRYALARCHATLAPTAQAFGYALPRAPTVPDRDKAMRQMEMAARIARPKTGDGGDG